VATVQDAEVRKSGTRTKKARFELRMPEQLRCQLDRAAEAIGVSATDVALRAIDEYSRRELERWETTRLTAAEAERFAEALSEPPQTNERLMRAIRRRSQLTADD